MVTVGERIQELDGRFVALALAFQLATLAFRALAWRAVLVAAYPRTRIPALALGCSYVAGVALNAFLPARGGEGAKVALARAQIKGSSIPTIAASLSVIVLLDAILGGVLIAILWATGLLPSLPPLPSVPALAPVGLGAGAAVVVVVALVAFRFGPQLRRLLASAASGFAVLRSPAVCLRTVVPLHLAAWATRVGVFYFLLLSFGIDVGPETAILLAVLNGAATAVPVPGGAGSQQLLATYALQGISTAAAVSFSFGIQVSVTVVNTIVGLLAAMLLFRTLRPVAAIKAARGH